MENELLRRLYHRLAHAPKKPGFAYTDECIVLVSSYAALMNRPVSWAVDRRNWPLWARKLALPSNAQMSRRLRTKAVEALIAKLDAEQRVELPKTRLKITDSKPLLVGGFSKDRDASRGHVPGGFARGYRLHAVIDELDSIEAHRVETLSAADITLAHELLPLVELDATKVRADSSYDDSALYALVQQRGGRLIAARRKPGTGLGHRAHHPHRLQAIEELEQRPLLLAQHRRERSRIEQCFGRLTNLGFGLWALPNFVRTLPRVRRWVSVKILLYHLYLVSEFENVVGSI